VLSVTPEATAREIRQASAALQRTIEAARGFPRLASEWEQEIQAIESRLTSAVQSLQTASPAAEQESTEVGINWQQVRARREFEKTETRVSQDKAENAAESHYTKARQCFSKKDYHSCIEFCTQAIQLREDVARYHHLLGEARSMNPELRWQKRAEESFLQACTLDPFNADYLVSLGRLYKRQGLHLRARKHLEKALGIVPNHEEARRELSQL
jgi:tetratricopeptide (TPR) repeat protein